MEKEVLTDKEQNGGKRKKRQEKVRSEKYRKMKIGRQEKIDIEEVQKDKERNGGKGK